MIKQVVGTAASGASVSGVLRVHPSAPLVADMTLSRVRIHRLIQGAEYERELRLNDGFVDALETFWNGDAPVLTIVARDEFVERLREDLLRTPRFAPEVLCLSDALNWAGPVALAETDANARLYAVYLGIAAHDPSVATLILDSDIFPIREISSAALLARAAPPVADTDAHSAGLPIGLFHGGAAADYVANQKHLPENLVSKRRQGLQYAAARAELAFWAERKGELKPALFDTMADVRWRRLAAEGWERQPWKDCEAPHFLRLEGAGEDPERALSVVYGTFHR